MPTTITPLQGTHIKHNLLVDLTVNETTYYLSSAYKEITYNSNNYTALGYLLNVETMTDSITGGNNDITITLSGIPTNPSMMGLVLTSAVKGSLIKIYRAFEDNTGDPIGDGVYLRYKGYVSNYQITEETSTNDRTNIVSLQCSNTNSILEKRITGRRTNPASMKRFFSSDTSFDRVPTLHNTAFDFGKEV